MKKYIALLLVIFLSAMLAMPAFCAGSAAGAERTNVRFSFGATGDYEKYQKSEFPKWALDLRRAECLFFGGLPIAFPVSALALGVMGKEASFLKTLGIACSVTAVIALVDYVIGVINEN